MFNYLLERWKCSCAKWWNLCTMQCINFVMYALQPARSFTCAVSADWIPVAGADLWWIKRELHLPHPQLLIHTFLSWHPQHMFSQSYAGDYFCASFQRQTEREKFGHSDILGLVPPASSPSLCTPSTWSSTETCFSFSWRLGDIWSSLRSSLFVLLLSKQKQPPVLC